MWCEHATEQERKGNLLVKHQGYQNLNVFLLLHTHSHIHTHTHTHTYTHTHTHTHTHTQQQQQTQSRAQIASCACVHSLKGFRLFTSNLAMQKHYKQATQW